MLLGNIYSVAINMQDTESAGKGLFNAEAVLSTIDAAREWTLQLVFIRLV